MRHDEPEEGTMLERVVSRWQVPSVLHIFPPGEDIVSLVTRLGATVLRRRP